MNQPSWSLPLRHVLPRPSRVSAWPVLSKSILCSLCKATAGPLAHHDGPLSTFREQQQSMPLRAHTHTHKAMPRHDSATTARQGAQAEDDCEQSSGTKGAGRRNSSCCSHDDDDDDLTLPPRSPPAPPHDVVGVTIPAVRSFLSLEPLSADASPPPQAALRKTQAKKRLRAASSKTAASSHATSEA